MAELGYACRITEKNFPAIASEKPDFDLDDLLDWLNEYRKGYFLRDPESPFDCQYLQDAEFFNMYAFCQPDYKDLFRRVLRL